jgi:hypothetical protein
LCLIKACQDVRNGDQGCQLALKRRRGGDPRLGVRVAGGGRDSERERPERVEIRGIDDLGLRLVYRLLRVLGIDVRELDDVFGGLVIDRLVDGGLVRSELNGIALGVRAVTDGGLLLRHALTLTKLVEQRAAQALQSGVEAGMDFVWRDLELVR